MKRTTTWISLSAAAVLAAAACAPHTGNADHDKLPKPTTGGPAPAPNGPPPGPSWLVPHGDLTDAIVPLATQEDVDKTTQFMKWTQEQAHTPATKTFKNVLVLQGADAERFMAAMHGISTSLDAKCDFCHDGEKHDFASDAKDKKKTARKMILMTGWIDSSTFRGKAQVTCWTCHRGASKGEKMPDDMQKRMAGIALPPELQNLPADKTAGEVFKNLQLFNTLPANKLPYVMSAFSVSLGVKCDFCHKGNDWAADDKDEKKFAREMVNATHQANAMLIGSFDDPAISCWTCHRGSHHPQRTNKPEADEDHDKD